MSYRRDFTLITRRSLLCMFIAAGDLTASAQAASFDCEKAKGIAESVVCQNYELSELDEGLASLYRITSATKTEKERSQHRLSQLEWIKARDACSDEDCVRRAYETRVSALSTNEECPLAQCVRIADSAADMKLLGAAQSGDVKIASEALIEGADPNACGYDHRRPLFLAASAGHSEVVKKLIAAKAQLNFAECTGWTALSVAAQWGHQEIADQLIAAGTDVDLGANWNPLATAAFHGHPAIVKRLLENHAQPDLIRGRATPLLLASRNMHVESVRLLLDAGANPNFRKPVTGSTPLFEAVGGFRVVPHTSDEQVRVLQIVKLLVEHGADVNVSTAGTSPLSRALSLKDSALAEFLIKSGAQPIREPSNN